MIPILAVILSVISAYLIGSFPTSFIIAKFLKGIDIREVGSKNAGATNVVRTVGKIPGIITLIIDIIKGLLVVTVIAGFFYRFCGDFDYDFYRAFLGLIAVCGHIWSCFLKFKGGKGVAVTLGVALGLAPVLLILAVIIWVIIFALTNYVSLASIIALIAFPIVACIFQYSIYLIIISTLISAISIYKHKENIKRLLMGEETKIILFKSGKS